MVGSVMNTLVGWLVLKAAWYQVKPSLDLALDLALGLLPATWEIHQQVPIPTSMQSVKAGGGWLVGIHSNGCFFRYLPQDLYRWCPENRCLQAEI